VASKNISVKSLSFRWKYILWPLVVLVLSLILIGFFYRLLPAELAYHFQNGTPDRWMSRPALIAWTVVPQFVFLLMAIIIIYIAVMLSRKLQLAENTPTTRLLSIMGNMVVLPQVILFFAMLQFFLYNSYQIHLIPLWIFAVIVMLLGLIGLGLLGSDYLHDRTGACHDGRDLGGFLYSDSLLLPLDGHYGRRNTLRQWFVRTCAMEVRNGTAR